MTLIVMDDDLPRIPRRLVDVLHQLHVLCLELGGEVGNAVGLKVEVEVVAFVDVLDGWVFFIDKLKMEDLTPGADTRVKVFVVELDGAPQLLGVEADG